MANSYEDFLGSFTLESPDFKRALKILIKYEIHVLLQRLSDTGEESVVITASIADRTNGHLGSQKGRSFLKEAEIKSLEEQFLSYCTGQSYEQMTQLSDDSEKGSPKYITDGQNEEVMHYEEDVMKRREMVGNDRVSVHGMDDSRSIQDSASETMDQSDDSVFDTSRMQRNNSVATLLSKLDESGELVRNCYEDNNDAAGRCNDVCCRGSYLDLVGPFIRPAIPSLDKSASFSTNKDEDSFAEGDTKSYVRENTYFDVVDLTVDKNTGRHVGARQTALQSSVQGKDTFQASPNVNSTFEASANVKGMFQASPNVNSMFQISPKGNNISQTSPNGEDELHLSQMPSNGKQTFPSSTNGKSSFQMPHDEKNIMSQTSFQQPCIQMPILRNDIQNAKNDFVYNGERLIDFGPMNKLTNNYTETVVSSHHTEVTSMSQSVILESQSVLRNQLCCETSSVQAAMSHSLSLENGFKRKICSRVPECKLRTLLEADSNNMPSFIDEKLNVSVKQEPEESDIQRNTTQGEGVVDEQGSLEKGVDIKENHLESMKSEIKQENLSSSTIEDGITVENSKTSTGRSLKFLCRYCGESFKNKQYRELHEKLHLTQHPYVCESCGAGYDDEKLYEEHSKIHITHPVLKCENCGYRTSRKFRMNSHREICGKPSKVFMCPYCQKPFLAKRYMKVHMKSHDLSNVHHCPYCVNTYPLKNSLLKHIKTKHRRF